MARLNHLYGIPNKTSVITSDSQTCNRKWSQQASSIFSIKQQQ